MDEVGKPCTQKQEVDTRQNVKTHAAVDEGSSYGLAHRSQKDADGFLHSKFPLEHW